MARQLLFYLGTILYFIPVAFLGGLSSIGHIQTIGKMVSEIMATYFFARVFYINPQFDLMINCL